MKKNKFFKILKLVLKYLLPVLAGWVEGDTHVIASALADVLSLF